VLLYFLHNFEFYLNFWNYKRKWKIKTRGHSAGPHCGLLPLALGTTQMGKWPAFWHDTARGGAVVRSPVTLWQQVGN
jgi:hypothetical protein